ELTLSTKYQRAATALMRAGHVPEGAIVMTDVRTGRVLVWASMVEDGPMRDIASEATAPSASVFKIITGTTLIEGGVGPGTRQCYLGGRAPARRGRLGRRQATRPLVRHHDAGKGPQPHPRLRPPRRQEPRPRQDHRRRRPLRLQPRPALRRQDHPE